MSGKIKLPLGLDVALFKALPLCKEWRQEFVSEKGKGCLMINFLIACGIKISKKKFLQEGYGAATHWDLYMDIIKKITKAAKKVCTVPEYDDLSAFLFNAQCVNDWGAEFEKPGPRRKAIVNEARKYPEVFQILE